MLAKCANPDCRVEFKYFRDGRLYEFAMTAKGKYCPDNSPPPKQAAREMFWLCAQCSRTMSLQCSGGDVEVVRRSDRAGAA
jgi:hypothetical protein